MLQLCAGIFDEDSKEKECAMKANSSTVLSHTEFHEVIKVGKAELYNDMINVAERFFTI